MAAGTWQKTQSLYSMSVPWEHFDFFPFLRIETDDLAKLQLISAERFDENRESEARSKCTDAKCRRANISRQRMNQITTRVYRTAKWSWKVEEGERLWCAVGETDNIIKLRWRCASINPINKMFNVHLGVDFIQRKSVFFGNRWNSTALKAKLPKAISGELDEFGCSIGIQYKNFLCLSVFFCPSLIAIFLISLLLDEHARFTL